MHTQRLSPRTHRLLDLATVALFAAAPLVLGFTGAPRALAWTLALVHLAMTVATRFGAEPRPVSLAQHGVVELIVGVALLVGPWALGWGSPALVFYAAAGAVILLVWALTRYHAPAAP